MLAATIFSLVAGLARIQAFAFQHGTQVCVQTAEAVGEDEEENERTEEEILGSFVATTIADLEIEKEYMSKLLTLARKVQEFGHESKFERLPAEQKD